MFFATILLHELLRLACALLPCSSNCLAPSSAIIAHLATKGTVLTEHVGLASLKSSGEVCFAYLHAVG